MPDETLTEKRDRAFIDFLLSTGVRISEALRLDRDDWKPQRMTLIGKGDRERPAMVTLKAGEAWSSTSPPGRIQRPPSSLASNRRRRAAATTG